MQLTSLQKAGRFAGFGLLGLTCFNMLARAESIPIQVSQEPIELRPNAAPNTTTAQRDLDGGTEQPDENVVPITESSPKTDRFSGNAGVDFRSQYNARGIVVQDQDVTIQPYLNLNYLLYQGKGFVQSVSATLGWWADFSTNTNVSNPSYTARNWTENDVNAGISIQFANRFSFSSTFTNFTSPAGGYREGRFINNVLAYNDSGLISPTFSLKPQFTFLYELPAGGQAGLQPNAWYFEPGLTPNITINPNSGYPINLAFPLRVGLGNQFYNGTTYGFFSVGPQITVPLAFLSSSEAKWNLNVGYLYYNLGDTTYAIAPNGSRNQNVFNLGISVNF